MLKYLFLTLLFVNHSVWADVPEEQVKEVNHLLNFVENSNCTINRNGSDYQANRGVSHIRNKYDYFRDDIHNTEDFIKFSATKSTMSGRFYTVTCEGTESLTTRDWLLKELQQYRSR